MAIPDKQTIKLFSVFASHVASRYKTDHRLVIVGHPDRHYLQSDGF